MQKTNEEIDEGIVSFLKNNEGQEFFLVKIKENLDYKSKLLKKRLRKLKAKGKVGIRNTNEGKVYYFKGNADEKKSRMKANIAAMCIAVLIMLVLAEAGFRAYYGITGKVVGINEEEKCGKSAFRKASNEENPNRFLPGDTAYFEYSEFSGVRPRANWKGNVVRNLKLDDGGEAQFVLYDSNTNNIHTRGLKDISMEKPEGITRIAVLGDSFTWGAETFMRFSYPSILENLVPDSEVLNFGIEGTGIDVMFLRWKYEVLPLKPDVVIMAMYFDDVRRSQPCIHKPRFMVEDGELEMTNFPPPSYEEILKEYKKPIFESYFIKTLLYNTNSFGGVAEKQYEYGFEILSPMLDIMKKTSEEQDIYFMVLLIERGNFDSPLQYEEMTESAIQVRKRLEEIVIKKNIPFASSTEIFGKENFVPNDYLTHKKGHFLPDGNGYLAQGIRDKLMEEGVIDVKEGGRDYFFNYDNENNILVLTDKEDQSYKRLIVPFDIIQDGQVITERFFNIPIY
ncbi:hypothetical protein KY366_07785 [Candidatus Woesearchaeota archaeon]|nr:hypothetical protein [Candidatus Woesearchaeota archaeon]